MQTRSDFSLRLKQDPALRHQVIAEQIFMVARGSPANQLSGIAAAVLMACGSSWSIGDTDQRLLATVWLGLVTTMLLIGLRLAWMIMRQAPDAVSAHRLGRWFIVCGIACAVLWGASSWVLLPGSASKESEIFVLVGTAMVLVGGASAQAAYRPMIQWFAFTMTGIFVAGLIQRQGMFYLLFAAAFTLLCFVTIMASRNLERALRDQIMFRMDRDGLTAAAEEARRQSELARKDAETAREHSELARKEAETAREQSEAARREADLANRAKTVFLTCASHDLRGPMHALGLYLESLQLANEDPQLRHQIDLSINCVATLNGLLASLLDISRITAGTIRLRLAAVRMNEVLERVEAQLRPSAIDKRLSFEVARTPAVVFTDDGLLERILVNLTQNAIRYTDKGRVIIRCTVRGEYLRCYVLDSGIGIPSDELQNIYEPFYQVANKARDRHKGLGMGLAIVRQLGEILNHRIFVRSVLRKGSVFAVRIPMAATRPNTTITRPDAPEHDFVRGAFVIVIDNDDADLHATTSTLREFGCRVISVASSQSAISKLRGNDAPPDLILTDYRLEDETGLTAAEAIAGKLREIHGDEFCVPVVVMSGDTSAEVLSEVNDHACQMLHKPVSRADLWAAMNQALASSASVTRT